MIMNNDSDYSCVFPDKSSNFKFIRSIGLKLRDSVFSSLGKLIFKAKVLDLFSGRGSYVFHAKATAFSLSPQLFTFKLMLFVCSYVFSQRQPMLFRWFLCFSIKPMFFRWDLRFSQ